MVELSPVETLGWLAVERDPHRFDRHAGVNQRRSGERNACKVQHVRCRFQWNSRRGVGLNGSICCLFALEQIQDVGVSLRIRVG